ncbi:hypothetical protein CCACVL1_04235, partial [Corchorus capsularis]
MSGPSLNPDYMIYNIFLNLPVKTLLRFHCVSKSYCMEIDSPVFINAHLNQSLRTKIRLKLLFGEDHVILEAVDLHQRTAVQLNNLNQ